jgi:hypothetical protein
MAFLAMLLEDGNYVPVISGSAGGGGGGHRHDPGERE